MAGRAKRPWECLIQRLNTLRTICLTVIVKIATAVVFVRTCRGPAIDVQQARSGVPRASNLGGFWTRQETTADGDAPASARASNMDFDNTDSRTLTWNQWG